MATVKQQRSTAPQRFHYVTLQFYMPGLERPAQLIIRAINRADALRQARSVLQRTKVRIAA